MAVIPIDARADIVGGKKGKLTPAQHAQLNAWCLAEKTGILDCLGRCEAYKTDYVDILNNEDIISFKSGYVVVCGRLIEIEDRTEFTFTTPNSGREGGFIVLKVDLLAKGENEVKIVQKQGDALTQNDLNKNPVNGVYEFSLYRYDATPNTCVLTRAENYQYVPDIGGALKKFEKSLKDEGKPLHGYDDSKGTIEERLTKLGFKEGSITLPNGTATVNSVKRQGNYCILELRIEDFDLPIYGSENSYILNVGKLQNDFLPKEEFVCYGKALHYKNINYKYEKPIVITINQNGEITTLLSGDFSGATIDYLAVKNIGYEAPPIEQKE